MKQGEVRKKNTAYYGIQKDGNDDPICETAKETQIYIKNRLLDSVGEGEGGMI